MNTQLTKQARRELALEHPVISQKFCISTPEIQRVSDIVLHTINTGRPSAAFHSPPRFGKTLTSKYIHDVVAPQACPGAATVLFDAQQSGRTSSPGSFYRELQFQSNLIVAKRTSADVVSQQLRRAYWARATEHGKNRLIFICDEGQRLQENEFRWLIDVFNYLQRHAVRVTSIFIGQNQIINRRDELITTGCTDIVYRFLSSVHPFQGVTCEANLACILGAYDDATQLEYPEKSGVSYSGFFLADAYRNGWRLKGQAHALWMAFNGGKGESMQIGVGMEWVAGAIQHVLTNYMDKDEPDFSLTDDDWKQAVRSVGYFDLRNVVNMAEGTHE